MTYNLHAVIAEQSLLESNCKSLMKAKVVPLNQSPLALLPITPTLRNELEQTTSERAHSSSEFSIFDRLKPAVASWISALSDRGAIAYVEAEYFGGLGGQSAVVWDKGQIVLGPIMTKLKQPEDPLNVDSLSEMAINKALRMLGVSASGAIDEFDTVGLGRFRHTQQW